MRQALARYATAYGSLDPDTVVAAYPMISTEELERIRRDFKNYKEYRVEIVPGEISIGSHAGGTQARVTCQVRYSGTPRAGKSFSAEQEREFRLLKQGGVWLIVGIR